MNQAYDLRFPGKLRGLDEDKARSSERPAAERVRERPKPGREAMGSPALGEGADPLCGQVSSTHTPVTAHVA